MSKTIDERIVQMEFDNVAFEKNAKQTMKTLNNLEKSLNLEDSAKSLEKFQNAANHFSLGNMSSNLDLIAHKLSTIGIVGIAALTRLTNKAIDTGEKMAKALTVDPVKSGLQEYETQINAIQTILANTKSKGSSLEDVNNALDELNRYADLTIYNFTEMTRNIGTFTAAGIDLERSVSAIKGIANLGAISGSKSEQLSTAMYQLSQALAAGTVKLQDWNSVVNAGMGGEIFQESLKETARVHGIEVDKMIAKEGSFRESLKNGWITSEVLIETLQKFTGDLNDDQLRSIGYTEDQIKGIHELAKTATDAATKVKTFTQLFDVLKETAQSGWTESWENIIGTFNEAQQTLTSASYVFQNLIQASSDARNELLSGWKDLGGRTALIESFIASFNVLASIVSPVKEAFDDIFPSMTAKRLYDLTVRLRDFIKSMQLTAKQEEKLKRTFKGLFAILDIGVTLVSSIVTPAMRLFAEVTGESSDGVLDFTGNIGDMLVAFRNWIKQNNLVLKGANKIVDFLILGIKYIKVFYGELKKSKIVQKIFTDLVNYLLQAGKSVKDFGTSSYNFVKSLLSVINKLDFSNIKSIKDSISVFLESLNKGKKESVNNLDEIQNKVGLVVDFIIKKFQSIKPEHIAAAGFILGLTVILKTINQIGNAAENVGGVAKSLSGSIKKVGTTIAKLKQPAKSTNILKIAVALGILAASIKLLSDIDAGDLVKAGGTIAVLGIILATIERLPKNATMMDSVALSVNAVAFSIALKSFVKVLNEISKIPLWAIGESLLIIIEALGSLYIINKYSKKLFSKANVKDMVTLTTMGGALYVFSKSLEKISEVDFVSVLKSLGNLLIMIIALKGISAATKKMNWQVMSSLLPMAIGLNVLLFTLSRLGKYKINNLEPVFKGLIVLIGLLGGVMLASKLAGKNGKSAAKIMTSLGTSLGLIVLAIKGLSTMSKQEIENGIYVIERVYVLFGAIVALSKLSGEHANKAGRLLTSMSIAMIALTGVMAVIGTFQESTIKKGLLVIGSIDIFFSILIAAAGRMSRNKNATKGIYAATVAVLALSGLIALVSVLKEEQIKKGIVAIGAASLMLSTLFLSIGRVQGFKITVKDIGKFALIGAVVTSMGTLMSYFVNMKADPKAMLSVSASVSIMSGAVAAITVFLSKFSDIKMENFKDTFVVFATLEVLLGLLAGVLSWINNSFPNTDNVIKIAAGASLALIGISAACLIVSKIPLEGAIAGAIGLSAFIAVLAGAFTFLGALIKAHDEIFQNVTAIDNMSTTVEALKYLGEGLGNFIGGLVKGVGLELSSALPAMATDVSTFMTNLQPFLNSLRENREKELDSADKIIEIVMKFAVAKFLNGMNRLMGFGKSIKPKELKNMFSAIGKGYAAFANEVNGVTSDSGTVTAAATSAETLTALAQKMPKTGGVLQKWFGEFDGWTAFTLGLENFGKAYAAYANSVSGITNFDTVETSAKAAESLAILAQQLPSYGGKLQKWFGEKTDLGAFGSGLEEFGIGLAEYSDAIVNVDSGLVEKTANAAMSLSILANSLPNTNTILEDLFGGGQTTLSSWSEDLIAFAVKFVNYSNAISNSDSGVITNTTAAVKALEVLSTLATETVGNISLSGFGNSLVSFGDQYKQYVDTVADADYERFTNVINSLQVLKDLCVDLVNPSDGLGFLSVKASLYELGNTGLESFIRSFTNGEQKLQQTGDFVVRTLVSAMLVTFQNSETIVTSRANEMGVWMVKGLRKGIGDNISLVTDSALETAGKFLSTFDAAMLIASPSKKMEERGYYTVAGYIKGIASNNNLVKNEGNKTARSFIEGVDEEIQNEPESDGFLSWLKESIGPLYEEAKKAGAEAANSAINAFNDGIGKFEQRTGLPATKAMQSITEKAKSVYGDTSDTVKDYWNMLGGGDVLKTVTEEASEIVNSVNNVTQTYEDAVDSAGTSKKKIVDIDNEILTEEEEYWRTLLRIKRQGADADKYNALSVKEFEQEIFEETLDLWKSYTDRLQSTASSVMNSHNLFAAVEKSEAKSKEELFKNLDGQIEEYRQYAETLAAVTFRLGGDENPLAGYLKTLGVSSLEQLKVINSMTDEELTRYAQLYDTKYAYATNIASQQITDFKKETEDKLAGLYGTLPGSVNLDEFAENFTGTLDSITSYVNDVVVPASERIRTHMEEMAKLLSGEVSGEFVSSELGGVLDDVYDIYAARASEYGEDIGNSIDTGMAYGLRQAMAANDAAIAKSDELYDVYAERTSDYSEIGSNIDAGVAEGITGSYAATNAARKAIDDINNAYKEAAEIHSPSELMEREVGTYLAEGVGAGMTGFVARMYLLKSVIEVVKYITDQINVRKDQFEQAGKNMGMSFGNGMITVIREMSGSISDSMYESLNEGIMAAQYAMDAINNIIVNGADEDFVIRPVMDLTNIYAGKKELSNIMSSAKGANITSTVKQNEIARSQIDRSGRDGYNNYGSNYTFNQYNTSPKSLSTVDIYRQTKNQISMLKEATSIR